MKEGRAIEQLKRALRRLPGVGPKTAQRMAFYLLERDRDGASQLAEALTEAVSTVRHCARCNNFSEEDLCAICTSGKRDESLLCVVETPADLAIIEQAGAFSGYYLVLMGHLSPLDGIGPDDLAVQHLLKVLSDYPVREVILATNLTIEGEATADYLSDLMAKYEVQISRLARGVPVGG
ncbi:MAG TPA: recombination protein RecR, partial [Gammaproteobacteria bacterium]|nr:recombination protein RecR [Gammaproteobacteria bacterium]